MTSMKTTYTIYKHYNIITNKVYIGLTKKSMESRWSEHVKTSKLDRGFKFHKAIQMYGEASFLHEQLQTVDNLETARELEIHYISYYNSFKDGYNSTPGGEGTYVRDILWRQNKSKEMEEKYKNGEWISPFADPEIHSKTMETRKNNGTNIFETNNPMFNACTKMKKLLSMPDMKNRKQWINNVTGERKQQIDHPEPTEHWENKSFSKGISKNKGIEKPKTKCNICKKYFANHTMSRHIKSKHESN